MTAPHVPLSVVIAATHPWPELELTLDSLWSQLQKLGGELIIAGRDSRALPGDFENRFPGLVFLQSPGASIFVLRSLAVRRAHGEIIAMTEDHCRLAPDWCAQALEGHRRYPEAAIVAGVVENGSPHALIDWANFFIAHGPMIGPVRSGQVREVSLAGAAFKREALATLASMRECTEMFFVRRLQSSGARLFTNGAMCLVHIQSYGFWNTFPVHYHNGRSIAGFRKANLSAVELLLRMSSCPILPAFLLARSAIGVLRKRRLIREFALSAPLIAVLACCHAAGEFVGYCAGPGISPAKLS